MKEKTSYRWVTINATKTIYGSSKNHLVKGSFKKSYFYIIFFRTLFHFKEPFVKQMLKLRYGTFQPKMFIQSSPSTFWMLLSAWACTYPALKILLVNSNIVPGPTKMLIQKHVLLSKSHLGMTWSFSMAAVLLNCSNNQKKRTKVIVVLFILSSL